MRICILSDAMGATPTAHGHGLGRAVHLIAEGLLAAGHDITLVAVEGSSFSGTLLTPCSEGKDNEKYLAKAAYAAHLQKPFDVFYDHGHQHLLSRFFPSFPIVNHYHDKWQPHAPNPICCSNAQRSLMTREVDERFAEARVIHNAIPADQITVSYRADSDEPYALFVGFLRDYKQPILAIEAAARGRFRLVMAGGQVGSNNFLFSGNEMVEYIGAAPRSHVIELMRGAQALLQLGHSEACPMVNIEAGLAGCPVAAFGSEGNLDYIVEGVNGYIIDPAAPDKVDAVIEAYEKARLLDRKQVRASVVDHWGSAERQIKECEDALRACAEGQRWGISRT
jgi:glycosyltransferase involved in cell wall biosynthesis